MTTQLGQYGSILGTPRFRNKFGLVGRLSYQQSGIDHGRHGKIGTIASGQHPKGIIGLIDHGSDRQDFAIVGVVGFLEELGNPVAIDG